MRARRLLRNVCYRAIILPVSSLHTRLICISSLLNNNFVRLKSFSNGNLIIQIDCFKKHSIWYELYLKNTSLWRAARVLTNEMSPSKGLRTWLVHIPELTITRLKLFSNANCSLDWNSHSMLYGSDFQCEDRDSQRQFSLYGAQMRSVNIPLFSVTCCLVRKLKIYIKISSKKENSEFLQTMMEYRHCVCVPPGT